MTKNINDARAMAQRVRALNADAAIAQTHAHTPHTVYAGVFALTLFLFVFQIGFAFINCSFLFRQRGATSWCAIEISPMKKLN